METSLAIELWLDALLAEGRSDLTVRSYRIYGRHLSLVAPDLESLEKAALRRWLVEYRQTHAPDTVRSVFVGWRSFFNWCVRECLLAESPLMGVRQPKVPRPTSVGYEQGQMRALFAYLAGVRTPVGLRNHALCAVLLDCGLRVSELCRLTVDDIADGALIVRLSKSGRPRIVPMGGKTQQTLGRYLSHGRPRLKPQSGVLFVNQFGGHLNRWGVQSILDRMSPNVGFHMNPHRFRHTAATSWLRSGVPTGVVMRLGGWATFESMERYQHLLHDDLVAAQVTSSPMDRLVGK